MDRRVLKIFVSALLFAPTLLFAQTQIASASFETLRLRTEIPAPVLEAVSVEGLPFTVVSMEGFGARNEKGLPALPFKMERVEVPQGAEPELVIDHVESYEIDLAAAGFPTVVFPAQGPRSKNPHIKHTFTYDAAAYASYRAAESPVALNGGGTLHNLRLAYVGITPVAYDPAAGILKVYTCIDYHIRFKNADKAATQAFKRSYASPAYRGLEGGILNSLQAHMPSAKAVEYTQAPVYVIVFDPMFRDSLQKFVAWKTLLGFRVVEAYTDQAEVGATREKIRAYLKGLYDAATPENPAPTYVLFVGDVAQIPNGNAYRDPYYGGRHVSDFYLCEYTGDRLPDVLYGRMSARNVDELMPQIDKVMYMENIPYAKTAFLDSSFLVAGYDAQGYGTTHLNPTLNYLHSLYYKDTLARHSSVYFFPQSATASDNIIGNINAGVGVGIYTAHGDWDGWANPEVNNTDVDMRFGNAGKYPFFIGNCCLTGKMDSGSCFAETLLRRKDAGAAVYIGASNSSYFDEDVYWAVGCTNEKNLTGLVEHTYDSTGLGANDAFFHTHGEPYAQWALSAAEIMQTGNMAVEVSSTDDVMKAYYWQIYHVFGDPSYMPYNRRPEKITAVYANTLVLGETVFEVSTWPYARVALSDGAGLVAFAMADAGGRARLDVSEVVDAGELRLCVSAQNGLPFIDVVTVAVPTEKTVIVRREEMRLASSGEVLPASAAWQYGRDYEAFYTVRNVGSEAVSGFTMRLVSSDTCVKFESEPFVYEGELQVNEEVQVPHAFAVAVSPYVEDDSKISYAMRIEFDGEAETALTSSLQRTANAPVMQLAGFRVEDVEEGNANGVLDAGEKAVAVISLRNGGQAAARGVSVNVSGTRAYVTVEEGIRALGDVASEQTVELRVNVEGAAGSYVQADYEIQVDFETAGLTGALEAASFMGPAVETFESGSFAYADWQNDEENPWEIDATRAHGGTYSAASKKGLADRASSVLRLEVEMPFDDEISFYCFTSTEQLNATMGDLLHFYIDGERKDRFGGESEDWKYVRYAVKAGTHTFEWEYKKDASESAGEDRVWIDDIRLPFRTLVNDQVSNEERGATTPAPGLQMHIVRAPAGSLRVALQSSCGEVSGVLRLVNAAGQTVAVLDGALRAGAEKEEHTYTVGNLPSGLYLCTFSTKDGVIARKVVL